MKTIFQYLLLTAACAALGACQDFSDDTVVRGDEHHRREGHQGLRTFDQIEPSVAHRMRQGLGVVRSVVRTGRRHDHGDRGRKPYARRTHGDDLGLCHQGRERHAARDAGRCERFGPGDALLCQDRRLGRQGRPDMGDGDHAGQRDRPGDERRRDPCGCGFLRAFGSADGHEDRAGQHVRNPQQLLDDRRLSGRCGRGRRG